MEHDKVYVWATGASNQLIGLYKNSLGGGPGRVDNPMWLLIVPNRQGSTDISFLPGLAFTDDTSVPAPTMSLLCYEVTSQKMIEAYKEQVTKFRAMKAGLQLTKNMPISPN